MSDRTSGRVAALEHQAVDSKAIRLLVGGLAHDFNNLLTAIAGHAAWIESQSVPGSEARESATAILKAAQRAAAIAEKLQGLARKGGQRREPVNLHLTIAEVVSLLRPITNGHIQIEERLDAPCEEVQADPEQMHELFLNLALNARESMPDGGKLTFATTVDECAGAPHLVVSVRDTGVGIPEADRDRIFEPFFSAGKPDGTGLGLTMVAGIVRQHHGRIRLDSELGCGSTFASTCRSPPARHRMS